MEDKVMVCQVEFKVWKFITCRKWIITIQCPS